jgi:putative oxidoreductase
MAGFVPAFIPGGVFWVYVTGLALVLACISILIDKQTRLACNLLGLMLIIFVLTIHIPGFLGEMGDEALPNLLKDLALAGAAFYFAGHHNGESASMPEAE